MRKKDKLYTANRFNQPLFQPDRERNNIFDGLTPGQSSQMNTGSTSPSVVIINPGSDLFNTIVGNTSASTTNTQQQNLTPMQQIARDKSAANPQRQVTVTDNGTNFQSTPIQNTVAGAAASGAVSGLLVGGAGSALSGGLIGAGISAGMGLLGAAGNAIADGYTIGPAGEVLNSIPLVGGVINRTLGVKTDQKKLGVAQQAISDFQNFNGDVGSFDELKGVKSMSPTNVYKGGWLGGGSRARRKNRALRNQMIDVHQYAERALDNNIYNLSHNQINDALANYSAFGGPIDTPPMGGAALDYGLAMDYLTMKKQQNQNKNQMTNVFAGTPQGLFALGGDIQMKSPSYSVGEIYDISEAEAKRLKKLGYEFTVVN